MWYEALPPLLIIGTLVYSYQIGSVVITKAMFGNPYRRSTDTVWERVMVERDTRVGGVHWKTAGLKNIPNE